MSMKLSRRLLTGTLAVLLSVTLAACGKQASSVTTTPSHHAKQTATSPSKKAYREAKKLIREGRYQTAIDRLGDVSHPSNQVRNLRVDLENYLSAKNAYDGQHYQQAVSTLSNRQSHNQELNSAMDTLSARAANAAQSGGNSSASSSSQNANSQPATKAKASSSSSSSSQTGQVSTDQAVVNFANKMGFTGSQYQIITQSANGQSFRFEVRRNNADNTVANMVGIYSYNSQTGSVTKVD